MVDIERQEINTIEKQDKMYNTLPNPEPNETLVEYTTRMMATGEYQFLDVKLKYINFKKDATSKTK